MARFEVTVSNGDRILLEHAAANMQEFAAALEGKSLAMFNEIKSGASTPPREVIVATSQIMLVRSIGEGMLGSEFRGKRSAA